MDFQLTNEPRKYFYELTQIPHGSTNEKALSDYLVSFAKEHRLEYKQDDVWNVIIRKPASEGYEKRPYLTIQAHMDMVCEKNVDTVHDFTKDPLQLYVDEEEILHANGTTLGADDGTGVAYMLAILADDSLKHPPLECIFTVQEEIGLIGAMHLKTEDVLGRRMISLDGGGETRTLLSSAGGCRVKVNKRIHRKEVQKPSYQLNVRGLTGGHSGGEIAKEKGNSIHLMARVLYELQQPMELQDINGGLKENAIARECTAVFATDTPWNALYEKVKKIEEDIRSELEFSDNGFCLEVFPLTCDKKCVNEQDTKECIQLLYLIPNGFVARSMAIEGLTMTSLNKGVVWMEDDVMVLSMSLRSMLQSAINDLVHRITAISDVFGATVLRGAEYPGWKYNPISPLRDTMKEQVQRLYGKELQVVAAHGGNECGVFTALHPEMDIINMGPVTKDIHTPNETLDLRSFDRTFMLLCMIISNS